MKEVWKPIIIESNGKLLKLDMYEISSFGRVRSYRSSNNNKCEGRTREEPRILKQTKASNGYMRIGLRINGKQKVFLIHRLVALTFLDKPNSYDLQVSHRDENKENNNVTNLEWCTASYNTNYGKRNETVSKKIKEYKSTSEWKSKNCKDKIHNSEAVVGVNVKTGEKIEFVSMSCANEYFNRKNADKSISATVRGVQKTAYGYYWYYKKDYKE